MYDQSLEQLIDAVIADGVITEQERRVVYKKAASFGIDQDEIEVYLEGRLQSKLASSSKSKKYGDVKQCPNCGANVGAFTTKCPECGHEFRSSGAVEAMENFVNRLAGTSDLNQKCELIRNYPVPNDKEALLEFISVAVPQSKSALSPFAKGSSRWILSIFAIIIIISIFRFIEPRHLSDAIVFGCFFSAIFIYFFAIKGSKKVNISDISEAWLIKAKAALNKAKLVSIGDAEFDRQIKIATEEYESAKKNRIITFVVCGVIAVVMAAMAFKPFDILSMEECDAYISNRQYTEAEHVVEKLNKNSSYDDDERFENYEDFMRKCILQMCEDKEYDRAKKFIISKKNSLTKYCVYSYKYSEKQAIEDLNQIIWQYEHPDKEYVSPSGKASED